MVIIFVLMVFVLIQANLAYRVSGQDATLGEMRQQLASLSELLNIERRASADLRRISRNCKSSLKPAKPTVAPCAQLAGCRHTAETVN